MSDVYPVSPWSEKQILSDMQQENVDYFFIEKMMKSLDF
ncbi:Ribosomal-protein-S18p-alanineacetyltransferase [Streptococcus sp. HSISB1]|nr:Ribosomal-protein-S18p-alanineacetyltransferase [Streptococcus sp. HSISB1]